MFRQSGKGVSHEGERAEGDPKDCFFHCPVKTRCLRQAMATKDGVQVEEEIIERSSKAGAMNFFERWSRKKQAHRRQGKLKD
jgi:hypothetical protein